MNPFSNVGGLRPRRTKFDLSYRKNFTCSLGQLIPIMCDEAVPGDTFVINADVVTRFQPLAAPLMHELNVSLHYFFVPYRIIFQDWTKFIKQGAKSNGASVIDPESTLKYQLSLFDGTQPTMGQKDTLWDYFGFPLLDGASVGSNAGAMWPIDFPWRAYNKIMNDYYADEDLNITNQVNTPDDEFWSPDNDAYWRKPLQNDVALRAFKKDYFTSARPFQQKGTPPALPVAYNSPSSDYLAIVGNYPNNPPTPMQSKFTNVTPSNFYVQYSSPGTTPGTNAPIGASGWQNHSRDKTAPNDTFPYPLWADIYMPDFFSSRNFVSFNVSDMRLAFQVQKWLERNARAGTRYTEFLQAHFGVSPSDARLQRPEYIGGLKLPLLISEILQTSESATTQQGNMSGHGLSADSDFIGKYHVQEFGLIMGIYSAIPKASYQQGINRQWLRRLPVDFYFPEFSHLSEQGIYNGEIYFGFGNLDDTQTFGFMGQYDEMRSKQDMVCSDMRLMNTIPNLSYWNLTRYFTSLPTLSDQFISVDPEDMKRIYLVPEDPDNNPVPGLIVNVRNNIIATRPLPALAEPGLIDHN